MCIIIIVIRKEEDKPDDEEECSFPDLAAAVFDLWYSVFSDVGIKSEYWSVSAGTLWGLMCMKSVG